MSERFFLIRFGAVGDVIHTLPLAAALRDAHPGAHICWAVEPGPGLLLQGNPDVDALCLVDTRAWRRDLPLGGLAALGRDARAVADLRADVAIDAQGLIKSGFLAWVSGAEVRVGFEHRSCREGMNVVFTTRWVDPPAHPHHVVEKNLSLLGPFGVAPPRPEALRFPLPERAEEGEAAEAYLRREGLAGGRPLLIVHPGAGWPTKCWGERRYAALGDAWVEMTRGGVLLTWGPGEEATVRSVAAAMRGAPKVAPPTDIREMAALIRRCDIFVGGDTGPMHLAAALGVPCLAIMGPTDPVRNGPWGRGHAVLHHRLACSGCYGRSCPDTECLERVKAPEAVHHLASLWEAHEMRR